MNTSNNPAAPENNLHHTLPYRSYDDWLSQFEPDPEPGEPPIFDEAYLRKANQHIIDSMGAPLDLDGWDRVMETEVQQVNLPARVAESATAGKR